MGQGDVLTAHFLGGAYELSGTLDGLSFTQAGKIKYYSIAGSMVAMNDGSGLQYLLTDHLGSVVATADSNGILTSQQRYMPFGQVRTDVQSDNPSPTDFA